MSLGKGRELKHVLVFCTAEIFTYFLELVQSTLNARLVGTPLSVQKVRRLRRKSCLTTGALLSVKSRKGESIPLTVLGAHVSSLFFAGSLIVRTGLASDWADTSKMSEISASWTCSAYAPLYLDLPWKGGSLSSWVWVASWQRLGDEQMSVLVMGEVSISIKFEAHLS